MFGEGFGAAEARQRGGDGREACRGLRGVEDGGEIVGDGIHRAGQEGRVDGSRIARVDDAGQESLAAAEAFEAEAVLGLFGLQGQDEDRDALRQCFEDQQLSAVADDQGGARQDPRGGQEIEDGEAGRVVRQGGQDGSGRLSAEGEGDGVAARPQGVDQVTREVCGNFILNTNNKASIRKTRNDRRYCPFFTPQQTEADVRRDGLNEQYMGRLFDWLKGEGEWASLGPDYGYAVVAEFLHTFPIPDEFNPAGACRRAPTTSSTEEAVSASYPMPEQIVLEAIEEERAGFRGGWVSGSRLAELMANNQVRMTPHARDALIVGLGYSRHPALKGGRPNNPVLPDAGRPVLYVKNTSPALGLTCPAAVAAEYTNAQRDPVGC